VKHERIRMPETLDASAVAASAEVIEREGHELRFVQIKVWRRTGDGVDDWHFDGRECVSVSISDGDVAEAFSEAREQVHRLFGVLVPASAMPKEWAN
jgi:hypothetical protein